MSTTSPTRGSHFQRHPLHWERKRRLDWRGKNDLLVDIHIIKNTKLYFNICYILDHNLTMHPGLQLPIFRCIQISISVTKPLLTILINFNITCDKEYIFQTIKISPSIILHKKTKTVTLSNPDTNANPSIILIL